MVEQRSLQSSAVVPHRWAALLAMALVLVTIGMDLTVLNVALPILAVDLRATSSDLQWFVNAYSLTMAASLLPAGRLGDRFGPRPLILGSTAVFGAASALCAWSGSTGLLIVGRAILGAAAGVFMPLSMSMLARLFSGEERSRAVSAWTAAVALGIPVGPVLGGFLVDHFWWGSVFLVNIPLCLVALACLVATLPATAAQPHLSVDLIGAVLAAGSLIALTYGLIQSGDHGWTSAPTLVPLLVGVVLGVLLFARLRRAPSPLIELDLFDPPQFRWGVIMATVASLIMMVTIYIVPQYAQVTTDTDALGLGLRLLPLIGGLVLTVPLGEAVVRARGYRLVVATGFVVMAIACGLAATTTTGSGLAHFIAWNVIMGIGIGCALPTCMDLAMSALDAERSGVGSAVVQSMRQLGGSFGVATFGTVLTSAYRGHLHLDGLPTEMVDAVQSSPSLGAVVARQVGALVPGLLDQVQGGLVAGLRQVFWGMCVLAALAAVVAAVRVPREPGSGASEFADGR